MIDKVEIDAIYNLADWEIKIIRIEEVSKKYAFRRVFYSKIGDNGEPFWLNEELVLKLANHLDD